MTEEEWEDKLAEVQRNSENWYEKYRSVQDLLAIEMARSIKYEKQIEKMKCCYNCKHSRTDYEHCKTNKHEKWELAE